MALPPAPYNRGYLGGVFFDFEGLTNGQTLTYNANKASFLPATSSDATTQTVVDVTQANGVTDNTTYLTAQNAAAIAAGLQLRIPSGTWVISNWTLPSNTKINATGATFIQASGTNTRMILNTSLTLGTPGSARDSNIYWNGGTFVKGTGQTNVGNTDANALGDHCVMFGFVDGLIFWNYTVNQSGTGGATGTGGRYGCYLWNVNNFSVWNYVASSASSSVNQSTLQLQYCKNGDINYVTGTYGDDGVALVNGNTGFDQLANGAATMENIRIRNVFATCASNGVRIMPGSTAGVAPFYNVQRCSVDNVRGSMGSRGGCAAVWIGGDSSGSYANLTNGSALNIEASNVTQVLSSTPAVRIDGACESHGIVCRAVNNAQDSAAVTFPTSTGHQSVKVCDGDYTTAITSGSYFPIQVTSTVVRRLVIENCRLNAATTGTANVSMVGGTGGPGWLIADGISVTGKAFVLADFRSTTRVHARGIEQEDSNGLGWWTQNTGAVVTVMGWDEMTLAGTNTFTQTAGSAAVKNGAPVPGFFGNAVLVGGTVTVTTGSGMVTSTSQIRLTCLAAGGTTGALTITSRGAGTFTITSTSAIDTSTVFWEIVNS